MTNPSERKPPVKFPAWVNGRIVPPGAPTLSVDDLGFQLGLAVFDTLLQQDGCRYFEDLHLARLERGARGIALEWPPPFDPSHALEEFGRAVELADCAVRMTYSRGVPGEGPTLVVGGRPLVLPPKEGVLVALELDAKVAGQMLEGVKATSRLRNVLAREAAQRRGAWEALLCTQDGDVSEGTISNVFLVQAGRVRTPSPERGCLRGITRDLLIDELRGSDSSVEEGRIQLEDFDAADEVFLTNTTGRLIPVRGVLGRREDLPGPSGPVFQALWERFRALEERYRSAKSG